MADDDKIKIDWNDLKDSKVEAELKREREARAGNLSAPPAGPAGTRTQVQVYSPAKLLFGLSWFVTALLCFVFGYVIGNHHRASESAGKDAATQTGSAHSRPGKGSHQAGTETTATRPAGTKPVAATLHASAAPSTTSATSSTQVAEEENTSASDTIATAPASAVAGSAKNNKSWI